LLRVSAFPQITGILASRTTKSVVLTEEGLRRSKQLFEEMFATPGGG